MKDPERETVTLYRPLVPTTMRCSMFLPHTQVTWKDQEKDNDMERPTIESKRDQVSIRGYGTYWSGLGSPGWNQV
jgi:hypothetical protein